MVPQNINKLGMCEWSGASNLEYAAPSNHRESDTASKCKLTDLEWTVLDKIATKSKMNCWFILETDENGVDFVYDREENSRMNLLDGISMLNEGITSLNDYELTSAEKTAYENLLQRLLT